MGKVSSQLRPGLYAITDNRLTPADTLIASVEAALTGGARLLQYRDKRSPASERLTQARNLNSLCQEFGVPLLINDDPELAARVGAAGVHLGQDDCSLEEARRMLGENAIIGITCHHSLDLARIAAAAAPIILHSAAFTIRPPSLMHL